jgi:hypothetical protein
MTNWNPISAGHPESDAVLVWDGENRWLAEFDPFSRAWFALAGDDSYAWNLELRHRENH